MSRCVQLLMWEMCPEKMKIFTKDVCRDGKEATEVSCLTMSGHFAGSLLFKLLLLGTYLCIYLFV